MKSVESALKLVVVALIAAVVLALALAGRTAVNRVADYREMTAPKSLHQLALESRYDGDERGGVLLLGAGLFALLLVVGGVTLFAATSGREFGRAAGRRRKRARRQPPASLPGQPASMPAMRILPPAPRLPALPTAVAEEGHYEG